MNMKTVQLKKIITVMFIVLAGLVIRLAGFNWGGLSIYQPDEAKLVAPVLTMASEHSLLSYNYLYPDQFLSKIQALALIVYDHFTGIGFDETMQAYWICRIITSLTGTVIIYIVYLIGERLKPNTGIISAALFAVSPYMVLMSKQTTGDVGALFGSTVTMLFALIYSQDNKYRYIVLMSLGSAIAMLEKWHGGGGTVFIAIIILLYCRSIKDLVVRGLVALFSFIGWIFILAPNVVLNIREVYYDGFLSMAVHDGETAQYGELLLEYIQWGFIHIGGLLYVLAVIAGIIIAALRKDKKYIVVLFGAVKILEMCFLNRAVPRWGLELYLSELILVAICMEWLITQRKTLVKIAASATLIVIIAEGVSACAAIDIASMNRESDIRAKQETFCIKNGISPDDCVSSYYSAFQPGGYRADGLSERVNSDGSNLATFKDGKLIRLTDKNYFAWTARDAEGIEDIVGQMDAEGMCIWSCKKEYSDVFFGTIWSIDHSWNDFNLIANNIRAFMDIRNGAVIGALDIRLYDISAVPIAGE